MAWLAWLYSAQVNFAHTNLAPLFSYGVISLFAAILCLCQTLAACYQKYWNPDNVLFDLGLLPMDNSEFISLLIIPTLLIVICLVAFRTSCVVFVNYVTKLHVTDPSPANGGSAQMTLEQFRLFPAAMDKDKTEEVCRHTAVALLIDEVERAGHETMRQLEQNPVPELQSSEIKDDQMCRCIGQITAPLMYKYKKAAEATPAPDDTEGEQIKTAVSHAMIGIRARNERKILEMFKAEHKTSEMLNSAARQGAVELVSACHVARAAAHQGQISQSAAPLAFLHTAPDKKDPLPEAWIKLPQGVMFASLPSACAFLIARQLFHVSCRSWQDCEAAGYSALSFAFMMLFFMLVAPWKRDTVKSWVVLACIILLLTVLAILYVAGFRQQYVYVICMLLYICALLMKCCCRYVRHSRRDGSIRAVDQRCCAVRIIWQLVICLSREARQCSQWLRHRRVAWSHTYFNLVRARGIYYFTLNLVLAIAGFSGILIETFVNAFFIRVWAHGSTGTFGSHTAQNISILLFFGWPFLLIAFAMFCEYTILLIFDCVNSTPLLGVHAVFLVVAKRFERLIIWFFSDDPKLYEKLSVVPDYVTCVLADYCFLILEIVPVASGIAGVHKYSNRSDRSYLGTFLRSYLWGALFLAAMVTLFYLLAVLCVGVNRRFFADKDEKPPHNLKISGTQGIFKGVRDSLEIHQVRPGLARFYADDAFDVDDLQPDIFSTEDRRMLHHTQFKHWPCVGNFTNCLCCLPCECIPDKYWQKIALTVLSGAIAAIVLWKVYRPEDNFYVVPLLFVFIMFIFWHLIFYKPTKFKWCALVVTCLVLLAWSLSLYLYKERFGDWFMLFSLPVMVVWCLSLFKGTFPDAFGRPFFFILAVFVLVGISCAGYPIYNVSVATNNSTANIMVNTTTGALGEDLNWSGSSPEGGPSYLICGGKWGAKHAQLSAIDLSLLSGLVYEYDCKTMEHKLKSLFPHFKYNGKKGVHMWNCTRYEHSPRHVVFDFPANDTCQQGTRVIAFKGTSTTVDALIDAVLWSTIKVLQWLDHFIIPVLSILQMDQVQWALTAFHLPFQVTNEQHVWNTVRGTVKQLVKQSGSKGTSGQDASCSADHVPILTGHSLGGGIAQVIGARLGIPVVAFSPPGIGYSALRFGLHNFTDFQQGYNVTNKSSRVGVEVAKDLVTVVMPDFDEVPKVDKQVGNVQHIQCRDKWGAPLAFDKCHDMRKTACELWRSCGDDSHPSRPIDCTDYFPKESEGMWFFPDDVD